MLVLFLLLIYSTLGPKYNYNTNGACMHIHTLTLTHTHRNKLNAYLGSDVLDGVNEVSEKFYDTFPEYVTYPERNRLVDTDKVKYTCTHTHTHIQEMQ